MKRISFYIILGWLVLTLAACAAVAEPPTVVISAATPTQPTVTPTIVWFPPSETPTAQPLSTTGPTPERKPGVGFQLLSDDFSVPNPWNPGASEEASLTIGSNRLTIAAQPGVNAFRVRQGPTLTNFYAEITARPSLCRGADEYGLLFRAPSNSTYYAFSVTCQGTAIAERVRLGKEYPLHEPVPSADVPFGPPGEVRLGVWASGADMRFFLNDRYQFSVNDPTLKAGAIGAFARSNSTTPITVIFSDLSVYDVTYIAPSATPRPRATP